MCVLLEVFRNFRAIPIVVHDIDPGIISSLVTPLIVDGKNC